MKFNVIQWNIGGGMIRDKDSDPIKSSSYTTQDTDYIVNKLLNHQADIVTLQETHTNPKFNQVEYISSKLGFKHFYNTASNTSHLNSEYKLGQAILSRFPLSNYNFNLFPNPKYELISEKGELWISHDKGLSSTEIHFPDGSVSSLQTMHLIPFLRFKVNPLGQNTQSLRDSMSKAINDSRNNKNAIITGDFNCNTSTIKEFLPKIISENTKEIELHEPTTVNNNKHDHIIFDGFELINSKIDSSSLTDHYPIIATLEK